MLFISFYSNHLKGNVVGFLMRSSSRTRTPIKGPKYVDLFDADHPWWAGPFGRIYFVNKNHSRIQLSAIGVIMHGASKTCVFYSSASSNKCHTCK